MKLKRESILEVMALLVIAASVPFALMDTFETGRIYLFSPEFWEDLPQRFIGPGRFRFSLQPAIALVLGVYSGLADARTGNPPYLFGLLFVPWRRAELMRSGIAVLRNLIAMGIILDVTFQWVLYRAVHPGAALLIGPILIGTPYIIARALANRLARGLKGKGRVVP